MEELNFQNQYNSSEQFQQPQKNSTNQGFAIASLVCGLLTIPLFFTVFLPYILGILAVVFGAVSLKSGKKGLAVSGIITGVIGMIITIVYIIVLFRLIYEGTLQGLPSMPSFTTLIA